MGLPTSRKTRPDGAQPGAQPAPRRRRWAWWLAGCTGGLALALSLLLAAAFDGEPHVRRQATLSATDLARVQALWQLADPRRAPPGKPSKVATTARDVDLLLHEGARRLLHGAAEARLRTGAADLKASVRVPRLPFTVWLNASATVRESPRGLPEVTALSIGRVPVPPTWAWWVVRQVAASYGLEDPLREGLALVQDLSLQPGGMVVTVRWSGEFVDTVRSALVPDTLQEPLRAQSRRLLEVVGTQGQGKDTRPMSLALVIPEMFDLAAQRTDARLGAGAAQTTDPQAREVAAQENRAALMTLALYAVGQPMSRLVPAARDWPQPLARTLTLAGREDHPQHMLVSAAIAAEAGGRLADAIGVLKEVLDRASGGSGFSFDDLLADRAGTRLGQRAVRDPFALQSRLRRLAGEGELMPSIEGLPSFMNEAAFRAEIGGEGSARYEELRQEIERRVAGLAVLQ